MNSMFLWLQRYRFRRQEFFVLVLIGTVANLYFLTNYSPSIDDELAAVRSSSEVWIAQGRFTTYLVETLLFPQASLPFSPYLFLAIVLALTQMLLVRAHGMLPDWRSHAAYCLFVTYPTWWLIEEFSANVPATGIGFLLVSVALFLQADTPPAARLISPGRANRLLGIGLLLALSAGTYQTFLLLFACGTLGVALCRSLQQPAEFNWKDVVAQVVYGGGCLIAGAALYLALNKLAQALSGTSPEYIASFLQLDNLSAPRWLLGSIAVKAWNTYSGSFKLFGAAMPAAGVALLCAAVVLGRTRQHGVVRNLLLYVILLGTPFSLCLLTGPEGLPLRSMVALPYIVWLSALLTFSFQRGAAWGVGVLVYAVFQLQILNLTSQYTATATLVQQQDRFMAFDIGQRMLTLRGSDQPNAPIWLDTYGASEKMRKSLYAAADTSVTRGSFFGWDNGNLKRIAAYFRVLGFDNVRAAPPAARAALTSHFEGMPVWPQPGSLRRSGDYYLLKLGSLPDDAHGGAARKAAAP